MYQSKSFYVEPKSFKILKKNSKRFKLRFRAASNRAVYRGGTALYRAVKENISRTDYSLEELRSMDHPYAKRHGRILTGKLGMPFNNKPYLIHTRSGKLSKDLNITLNRSESVAKVYFGGSVSYAEKVLVGTRTSRLIPRDVISGTANEPKVKREIVKEMTIQLKEIIKSYGSK